MQKKRNNIFWKQKRIVNIYLLGIESSLYHWYCVSSSYVVTQFKVNAVSFSTVKLLGCVANSNQFPECVDQT